MKNFTFTIISFAVLVLLLSIVLPTLADTLTPLSGSALELNESGEVKTSREFVAPDSMLYNADRTIEELQLGFSLKRTVKAQLLAGFALERSTEATLMVNKNRPDLAAQTVSDMVQNLQHLEELQPYLPEQVADTLKISDVQAKKNSALAVAITLDKITKGQISLSQADQANIRNYFQIDKASYAALEQLSRAQNTLNEAVTTGQVSAIQSATEKLEQAKELVNEAIDNRTE